MRLNGPSRHKASPPSVAFAPGEGFLFVGRWGCYAPIAARRSARGSLPCCACAFGRCVGTHGTAQHSPSPQKETPPRGEPRRGLTLGGGGNILVTHPPPFQITQPLIFRRPPRRAPAARAPTAFSDEFVSRLLKLFRRHGERFARVMAEKFRDHFEVLAQIAEGFGFGLGFGVWGGDRFWTPGD